MIFVEHISIIDTQNKEIIKDVSFSVEKGTVLGLIGPEKNEKSSLLKAMNGLVTPSIGSVRILNRRIGDLKGKDLLDFRKSVSFLHREPLLLDHLTLLNNVLLPLENLMPEKTPANSFVEELLRFFDLQGLESAHPKQLSKFICYKVALARCLVSNPAVLLVEDLGQILSSEERQQLLFLLEKWNETYHTTIVISTDDIDTMKQLCQKAIIINKGQLVEAGDPYQLISSPKHSFTAQFLSKHFAFDLPEEVRQRAYGTIVLIEYAGDEANEPVLYEVSQRFGVEYNILQGRIEYIRGKALGKLYVSFNSEPELMPAVLSYLSENAHHVEVVQHD